jgi:hypothetical protein
MLKSKYIQEFQKRLPDDILFSDETNFEINEDEYVSILSWLKYFKEHYKCYGKEKQTLILFPIISKRLRLDFGLYNQPSDLKETKGQHIIYLTQNGQLLDGTFKNNITVKQTIDTWGL